MKKAILVGVFASFVVVSVFAISPPPLDRYGGNYQVTPDTTTLVHYKYWIEPNANEFEYRAMLADISAIWKADTAMSECSRWRAVNLLLETRVDPYITYPPGVFRSTVPFDENSLVYYSTGLAVAMGFFSTSTVNSQVAYTTMTICNEGRPFKEQP